MRSLPLLLLSAAGLLAQVKALPQTPNYSLASRCYERASGKVGVCVAEELCSEPSSGRGACPGQVCCTKNNILAEPSQALFNAPFNEEPPSTTTTTTQLPITSPEKDTIQGPSPVVDTIQGSATASELDTIQGSATSSEIDTIQGPAISSEADAIQGAVPSHEVDTTQGAVTSPEVETTTLSPNETAQSSNRERNEKAISLYWQWKKGQTEEPTVEAESTEAPAVGEGSSTSRTNSHQMVETEPSTSQHGGETQLPAEQPGAIEPLGPLSTTWEPHRNTQDHVTPTAELPTSSEEPSATGEASSSTHAQAEITETPRTVTQDHVKVIQEPAITQPIDTQEHFTPTHTTSTETSYVSTSEENYYGQRVAAVDPSSEQPTLTQEASAYDNNLTPSTQEPATSIRVSKSTEEANAYNVPTLSAEELPTTSQSQPIQNTDTYHDTTITSTQETTSASTEALTTAQEPDNLNWNPIVPINSTDEPTTTTGSQSTSIQETTTSSTFDPLPSTDETIAPTHESSSEPTLVGAIPQTNQPGYTSEEITHQPFPASHPPAQEPEEQVTSSKEQPLLQEPTWLEKRLSQHAQAQPDQVQEEASIFTPEASEYASEQSERAEEQASEHVQEHVAEQDTSVEEPATNIGEETQYTPERQTEESNTSSQFPAASVQSQTPPVVAQTDAQPAPVVIHAVPIEDHHPLFDVRSIPLPLDVQESPAEALETPADVQVTGVEVPANASAEVANAEDAGRQIVLDCGRPVPTVIFLLPTPEEQKAEAEPSNREGKSLLWASDTGNVEADIVGRPAASPEPLLESPSADVSVSAAVVGGDAKQEAVADPVASGRRVTVGLRPWVALVGQRLADVVNWRCAGTLLSSRTVLTAAHCVGQRPASQIKVRLGEHDLSTVQDNPDNGTAYNAATSEYEALDADVARIVLHPDYRRSQNDLALLLLSEPVTFGDRVQPVCLPAPGVDHKDQLADLAGWGELKHAGEVPQALRNVQMRVTDAAACLETYRRSPAFSWEFPGGFQEKKVCVRAEEELAACPGDPGGPLVVQDADGRYQVIGVASGQEPCGNPDYPGIYTKVSQYIQWIEDNAE